MTPLIVGNWKMNLGVDASVGLVEALKKAVGDITDRDIVVCPSFTALEAVSKAVEGTNISLGAQNVAAAEQGAYTGEISASMLTELNCRYVIVGHSERRKLFKEDSSLINQKIQLALQHELQVILCVGESLAEREAGQAPKIVQDQLTESLKGIKDSKQIIVAYEPVWAIGTGKNATPEQAQEVHAVIRAFLQKQFGTSEISILYGGSVHSGNIDSLMQQKDVDGVLVGGASLKADEFEKIIRFKNPKD